LIFGEKSLEKIVGFGGEIVEVDEIVESTCNTTRLDPLGTPKFVTDK